MTTTTKLHYWSNLHLRPLGKYSHNLSSTLLLRGALPLYACSHHPPNPAIWAWPRLIKINHRLVSPELLVNGATPKPTWQRICQGGKHQCLTVVSNPSRF